MKPPKKVPQADLDRLCGEQCCQCGTCGTCIGILGDVVNRLVWLEKEREAANRPEKCEGCGKPPVTSDNDGVPLCRKCGDELLASKRIAMGRANSR